MTRRRISVTSSHRSPIRQALYLADLARARLQTPEERLKLALELSDLCLKLKSAAQTTGREYGKA